MILNKILETSTISHTNQEILSLTSLRCRKRPPGPKHHIMRRMTGFNYFLHTARTDVKWNFLWNIESNGWRCKTINFKKKLEAKQKNLTGNDIPLESLECCPFLQMLHKSRNLHNSHLPRPSFSSGQLILESPRQIFIPTSQAKTEKSLAEVIHI